MNRQSIHLLLVEGSPTDAALLQDVLADATSPSFVVTHVERVQEALHRLRDTRVDVVLADLGLPESQSLETITRFHREAPGVPLVVLTSLDDETLAAQSITAGAQDCLVKGECTTRVLVRVIRYAIERKQAEVSLRKQEMQFRAVVDSALDTIISIDSRGDITHWNPSAAALFGYPAEETIGRPVTLIIPERFRAAHNRAFRRAVLDGESTLLGRMVELAGLKKDGGEFPLELSLTAWRSGEDVFFTAVIRDITLRRQAEGRIRRRTAALQAAANGILITDREGAILWVNPAMTALTGYAPEEMIGRTPRIWKTDYHDHSFYREMWDTILVGGVWHGEVINRRKDGRTYTEEMTITPVRDEKGEIVNFVAVKDDITERKQAEEALRKERENLERTVEKRTRELRGSLRRRDALYHEMEANYEALRRTEQTREALEHMIVHDLNNPLTVISGRIALLQMVLSDRALERDYLLDSFRSMAAAAEEMSSLIKGLLDVSRLEAEQMPVSLCDLNAAELARRVHEEMAFQAKQAGAHLSFEAESEKMPVRADADLLPRVLRNLLTNAFRYAGHDAHVLMAVRRDEGQVYFSVADDGPGIPEAYQTRIFDKYFQVESRKEGKKFGVGLGLTFCRMATEAQGGTIRLESREGEGSRFTVILKAALS